MYIYYTSRCDNATLLLGRRMHYVQRREKILDALRTFVYEIFLETFYVKIKLQFTFLTIFNISYESGINSWVLLTNALKIFVNESF